MVSCIKCHERRYFTTIIYLTMPTQPITARDLRIGNLLQTKVRNAEVEVRGIHFELRDEWIINGNIPVWHLSGIHITSEWLERFGWKHTNTLGNGRKVYQGEPYLYETENGYMAAGTSLILTYVHQLQNYYFVMRDQELTPNK